MMLHNTAYVSLNMDLIFSSEFFACYSLPKKTVEICLLKFTYTLDNASIFSVNRFANLFGNKLFS